MQEEHVSLRARNQHGSAEVFRFKVCNSKWSDGKAEVGSDKDEGAVAL
jgi:hypothetical protein